MRRSYSVLAGTAAATALLVGGCAGTAHTASSAGKSDTSKQVVLTRANFASTLSSTQKARGTFHTAMTMTASGQNIAMTGDFNTKGSQLLASMRMTVSSAAYTIRMIGSTMYMSQGSSDTWVKLDLSKMGNSSLSQLTKIADNLDLSQQIANLGKNASSFTKIGSGGTIDGVSTTRYRVVVDTDKALAAQGVKASDLGNVKLPKSFTYDLYVGSDGLPRRLTMSTLMPFTMNISKWGQPVSVTAPPANKVTDLTSKYASSASSSAS